ncbi:Interferon-induced GTP-binding protein MxA [Penicillium subrubescens]|uniref:Interferon-induced GTP-binding protein MxA n=1 Tax=Penicillium subrubescens TaxID=1316194 RepID=A0A1Q5SXY6_9EURO|nr:Interferon-induced GTP-binding protein MxA [Penicillium subrubescens]
MTRQRGIDLTEAEGLDNEKRLRLLGIIDRLRELGISENVSLPQIVLRRAPAEDAEARITIIPGPTSRLDEALNQRLLAFERRLAAVEFGYQEFEDIFDEAATCMGVPGPKTANLEDVEKRFSDDILKIELSGPDHRHLSVVDVPGLFHNPTKFQTEEDRAIIRKLIQDYLTDKRTIILVLTVSRFSMARAADPAGKRTVGIITKCDALQAGDEAGVLSIAKNEVERLTHGWFVVRNRSTQEIQAGVTIEERHRKEKQFFSTAHPWTELRKDRVGINALKSFLGHLLYDHIRSEFPAVVEDIERLSLETQKELEVLGPSRQTPAEQRRFLTRISTTYQNEVEKALRGNYSADLDALSPLKLRMHIRQHAEDFAKSMATNGHAKVFRTIRDESDPEFQRPAADSENIYDWIRRCYLESRGSELPGTVNPVVLENMFRQQSSPWEKIALRYLENVASSVHSFNKETLSSILPDDDIREKLWGILSPPEQETYRKAHDQLLNIVNDERDGVLQTVNHYYADTLSSIRQERVTVRLEQLGLSNGMCFDMSRVLQGVHLSNEDQAVFDIHDILKAFYKVAMKRFMDNVVIQVCERYILGDGGPVKTFSPDLIGDFEEDKLTEIAGENFTTASRRNDLLSKAARFREALEIAKRAVL